MKEFFTNKDNETYKRLLLLKELVGGQEVHGNPCPLLVKQLQKIEVYSEDLLATATQLRKSISSAKE